MANVLSSLYVTLLNALILKTYQLGSFFSDGAGAGGVPIALAGALVSAVGLSGAAPSRAQPSSSSSVLMGCSTGTDVAMIRAPNAGAAPGPLEACRARASGPARLGTSRRRGNSPRILGTTHFRSETKTNDFLKLRRRCERFSGGGEAPNILRNLDWCQNQPPRKAPPAQND